MDSTKSVRAFHERLTAIKISLSLCLKITAIMATLCFLGACGGGTSKNTPLTPLPDEDPPSDPPPIIIKSGSFIFEGPANTEEPPETLDKDFLYKVKNISIKQIWVCLKNGSSAEKCQKAPSGLDVNIWFASSGGGSGKADVIVKEAGNDFQMLVKNKKLKCGNSGDPLTPKKCEDTSVNISNFDVNGSKFTVNSGDIYAIRFYDK